MGIIRPRPLDPPPDSQPPVPLSSDPQPIHPATSSSIRPKFHLRTTLVVPVVLQISTAFALVGLISYQSGQQAVRDVALQLRAELTNRIEEKLASYTTAPHAINRINASDLIENNINLPAVTGELQMWQQMQIYPAISYVYCGNENGDFLGTGRLSPEDRSRVILQFSNSNTNFIRRAFDFDQKGNRTQEIDPLNKRPFDPRLRPWYKAAKNTGAAVWSEIYLDFSTLLPTVTASLPVYDEVDGRFIGACATDFYLPQELSNFMQTLQIGKTGTAFIVDRSGSLVATSAQETMLKGTGENTTRLLAVDSENSRIRDTARFLQTQSGDLRQIQAIQQLDFTLGGQRQYVQIVPFKNLNLDWLIVLVIPEADFMATIYENTRYTIFLTCAALAGVIILGIWTARWIASPLGQFTRASEDMAAGNLDQHLRSSRIFELDRLGKSFNYMAAQLRASLESLRLANEKLEERVEKRTLQLRQEKERSEQLLLNILPAEIAERLKQTNESPAEHFAEATILFADIVGFTGLSSRMEPMQLVAGLNQIFSAFDQLTEKYGLEKIKTIGDAYMVVGGLPVARPDHAQAIAAMALDMLAHIATLDGAFGEALELRIGINTGSVIAGVIGIKKFTYDLWGDAVNVASRMESHGKPGYIQVTEATYQQLKDLYVLEPRGSVQVKGRGEMITYWLVGRR
ncbi:MAG: HAMP domain-containing protein [Coleofasciculaceae cyanobacterium SM2_1_6]|nr:HAMP domain-containing protein [Coleofasciculaceae cyanobacterium SM2_1_6]